MAFHLHINEIVEIQSLKGSKVFPHSTSHLIWQIEVKCGQIDFSQWRIQDLQDGTCKLQMGAPAYYFRQFSSKTA